MFAGILTMMPVLYALSIGPAWHVNRQRAGVYEPGDPAWAAIDRFYAPLDWLSKRSSAAKNALNWYVDLWIPETE